MRQGKERKEELMQKYKPDTEERIYKIEGIGEYPSVTTIIGQLDKSPQLMGWAVKTMYEYLLAHQDELKASVEPKEVFQKAKTHYKELQEQALDFGSELHNLLEVFLKEKQVNGLLETNPRLKQPFEEFKKWQTINNFKLVENEHIVWSEAFRYAGTLDCVAYLNDNKLYLIDFKSSKAIYDDFLMQVAAYMKAFEERSKKEIEGVGILRLPKQEGDSFEWREYTLEQANNAFNEFMHLCSYWWEKKRNKKNG